MKRPSFQFYPGDWLSNKKLRRCSPAERGAWIDLICLLHDPDQAIEYGLIRWPLEDIAQAISCPVALLRSLRVKGVLKGADVGETCAGHIYTPRHAGKDGEPVMLLEAQAGPLWFSSRMLEDEHIRLRRSTHGEHQGAPKDPPKGGVGGVAVDPLGGHPSRDARAQSSSSSSSETPRSKALSGAAPADGVDKTDESSKAKSRAAAREVGKRVIEYLNAKAGTKYRPTEANLKFPVDRQLVDKATEEELRAVVDAKVAETSAGKFDRKYLRPETLWNATKFGSYVGQVGVSGLSVVKTIHVAVRYKAGGQKTIAGYTWTAADFDAFELVVRTGRNPKHLAEMTDVLVASVVVYVDKEAGLKGIWSPAEVKEGMRKAA